MKSLIVISFAYFATVFSAQAQDLLIDFQNELVEHSGNKLSISWTNESLDNPNSIVLNGINIGGDGFGFTAESLNISKSNESEFLTIRASEVSITHSGSILKTKNLGLSSNMEKFIHIVANKEIANYFEEPCDHDFRIQLVDFAYFNSVNISPYLVGSFFDLAKSQLNEQCQFQLNYDLRDVSYLADTPLSSGQVRTEIKRVTGNYSSLESDYKNTFLLNDMRSVTQPGNRNSADIISFEELNYDQDNISLDIFPFYPVEIFNEMVMGRYNIFNGDDRYIQSYQPALNGNLSVKSLMLSPNFAFQRWPTLINHYSNEYVTLDAFSRRTLRDTGHLVDVSVKMSRMGSFRLQLEQKNEILVDTQNVQSVLFQTPVSFHNLKLMFSEYGLDQYINLLNNGRGRFHGNGLVLTLDHFLGQDGLALPDDKIESIIEWIRTGMSSNIAYLEMNSSTPQSFNSLRDLVQADWNEIQNNFSISR